MIDMMDFSIDGYNKIIIPWAHYDSDVIFRHKVIVLFVLSVSGVSEIDQIISVLLRTSMAISGGIAFFLDNIIPGTAEERGIRKWRMLERKDDGPVCNAASIHVYDLAFTNQWKIAKYLPFLPYYREDLEIDINEDRGVDNHNFQPYLAQSDDNTSTDM